MCPLYRAIIDLNLPEHPKCMSCLLKEIREKFDAVPRIPIGDMFLLDENDIEAMKKVRNENGRKEEESGEEYP